MRWFSLAAAAVAVAASVGPASGAERFVLAHGYATDSIVHKWALWAAEEIAKRTNDAYHLEIVPAASVGTDAEIYERVTQGSLDMGLVATLPLARTFGPLALASAPGLFRDYGHWRTYRESELFRETARRFEVGAGLQVLGLTYAGQYHLTSRREVADLEDLRGLTMAVDGGPLHQIFPQAVGAQARPVAPAARRAALDQDAVDSQVSTLGTLVANRLYEAQDRLVFTGHMMDSIVTLMSSQAWARLSAGGRLNFVQVLKEAASGAGEEIWRAEAALVEALPEPYGLQVQRVDRAALRDAMRPLLLGEGLPWTAAQVEAVAAME